MGNSGARCEGCGDLLVAPAPARGLAHASDRRRFCERCFRLFVRPPSPTQPVAAARGPSRPE